MNLTKSFVDEYTRLDAERDTGDGIWKLCEMSAQVVVPRGSSEDLSEYQERKRQDGRTKQLAVACRKKEDTIERRAFAWRMWDRFCQEELREENGEELDFTHRQIRDRLFYTHFASLGRVVERNDLTTEQGTDFIIMAVQQNWSVDQMMAQVNQFLSDETDFDRKLDQFRRKGLQLLGEPKTTGRFRRLLRELVGTDWKAKMKL